MTDESYDMTTIEGCIGWGLFRNPPERRRLEAELARLRAVEAEVARLRASLRLTRPALVTWDDYHKGTVWCCCCDRQVFEPLHADCPHGAICPLLMTAAE